MRNDHRPKSNRRQVIQHTAPLPVPVGPGGLPKPSKIAQLDQLLGRLYQASRDCRFANGPEPSYHYVDFVKSLLPQLDDIRAQWRAVDRPASRDEMATEIFSLVTALPTAGNIDPDVRTNTLCADIAELQPSLFVLNRACRAVRGSSEFLSQARLEKEIRRGTRRADDYSHMLKDYDAAGYVAEGERHLLTDQAEAERKAIEQMKQHLTDKNKGKLPDNWRSLLGQPEGDDDE
jgi:hypothetical protein